MNPFDLLWSLGDIQDFVDHAMAADEGDPWGFAGLGADGVGTAQSFLGKAAETPVIEAGLITITIMNGMCGFGDSEKGDRFGNGGSKFNDIIDKLKSASPDGTWQGSASDAYTSQNVEQQSRASTMVGADFEMNQIISCEANQLSGTRDILDHAGTVLGYAILPALAAMRIGGEIGWMISMGIQLGAVGGTVPVCQAEMIQMASRALDSAESVRKVIDKYNSVNPDPKTRTQQVGLWGAPRSGSTAQSTDGAPGGASSGSSQGPASAPPTAPPNPAPHTPTGPAPTVPASPAPTVPASPAPTAPTMPPTMPSSPSPTGGSGGPSVGSPPPSIPPATPAPSTSAASQGNGSAGIPSRGAPARAGSTSSGSAAVPTLLTNQFAVKSPAPQAAPGRANGERAPVRVVAQAEGDAQGATNRRGENDVR
jgi:hypothetical protein